MKRYPSQVRYDKKNPMVSVRLTKDARKNLDEVRRSMGRSYSQIVRDTLLHSADLCKRVREATINEYALYKYCGSCEKPVAIMDDEERLYLMELYDEDIVFICSDCAKQHSA